MSKKRALGRGLSELLNENDRNYEEKKNKVFLKKIDSLEIDLIKNNPFQPRSNFNIEKINELASSIDKYGIIIAQKYLVEVMNGDNRIIIYNGIIEKNVLTRYPPKGDFIANLARGGKYKINV